MRFIRYGALVPQPHEPTDEWFHSPPCKKGFYAFPEYCIERFLLGGVGMGSVQNGRYRYVKINGKKVNLPARELWEQDDEKHEYKEPFLSEIKKQGLDPKKVFAWKTNADEVNKKFDSAEYCLYDDEDIKYTPKDERWDSYLFTLVVENPPHKFEYNGFLWHHMDKWCDHQIVPPGEIIKSYGSWVLTDIKTFEKALKKYKRFEQRACSGIIDYNQRWEGIPSKYYDKDCFEVFIESLQKTNNDKLYRK